MIIEPIKAASNRAALAFLLLSLAIAGCGQPQVGSNKEAFKTVDALYTAVGLRDAKLVAQCEARLNGTPRRGLAPGSCIENPEYDHR